MSISDFREVGDSPNRPSAAPLGSILQAFPPSQLDIHFRNGYVFRLDPCNIVTGYSPEYCDVEHAPKMDPSFYGPNIQVPVRLLQAAFACSAVGATDDELRYWAKTPLQQRLWAKVDDVLTTLLQAQAVNQTPFPIPGALVLAQAAQYLATNSQSGTGIIYGPMSWLSQLGMDYLIRWNEAENRYEDAAGNIIIPSSVNSNIVYAFDSFVDIKTSDIQVLDEFMPAQRTVNDRTVRAEQLYTVAIGPCVVGSFQVGITAIGDSVIVEPGTFPINVVLVSPNPVPVTFAGGITVNQGSSPWVVGDGGGSITVDGPLTDTQLRAAPVPVTFSGGVTVTQSGVWSVGRTWGLSFAADKVDASGSTVALDAPTLAALESITVQNPAGAGAVNIQDGGNSITIDAVALDTRHATFVNDKVDVSGSTVNISGAISATIDYSYAEDSVHVSGDKGAFVLAVRNDAATVLTSNNGDYSPVAVDSAGRVLTIGPLTDAQLRATPVPISGTVTVTDGSGPITVDGTVSISGTVGVTQSTSPWVVSGTVTSNQGTSPWVTSLDATTLAALESITVQNPSGAGAVNIQDGGNSITVDGTVAISGTVAVTQSTSPWVVSGTVTDSTAKAEDVPATTGDLGIPILAVRNDTAASKTSNDGDYSMLATDAAGRIGIADLGGSITVDGTVAVTQSTSPWVTSLDATTLAALESITVQNPGGASAVNIQDGGNSITVDGTVSISGTVTVDTELPAASVLADADPNPTTSRIGANNLVFNGTTWDRVRAGTATGSLLINNPTAANLLATVTIDAASLAALESITVQNPAGASAVNIQDGGNSITVDGSVSITGTVAVTQSTSPWVISGTVTADTELPAASALADADPNPTTSRIGTNNLVFNGTTWDRVRAGTATGSVLINNPTAANLLVTATLDAASLAALESITVQNPSGAGAVNIQDGGNSITVDGSVSITGSVAVTGPLTDTQLRASAVPVSGPLTDTQLRATPVPVSGTVAVTQSTSPWIVSGTVASNAERAEDSGHTSGQIGNFVLGVRNDAAAVLTSTDLDYTPFATDSAGRIGISDLGGAISVDDNGGSLTVDGTVSISGTVGVTQSTSPWVVSNPTLSVVGGGTEATALRVTIANNSTGVLAVTDNGGSLTVDGTVAATQSGSWSVTNLNGAGAAAVNIQDGGNSITVDGTVAISGTVAVTQSTTPWVVSQQSGTITNGAETAVSSTAVQILASNVNRKKYIIQNTGTANIRVGTTGVTATTGARVVPNGTLLFEMPNCPTQAIFAIRENTTDSIAFAEEIT